MPVLLPVCCCEQRARASDLPPLCGPSSVPYLLTPHLALPSCLCVQVQEKLKQYQGQPFTMQTMAVIKNLIEGW